MAGSEQDYSPLSAACVRALKDKIYDKRKAAATEIEKMTKDFVNASSHGQIQRLVQVLAKDMALSPYSDMRKGGLIGLSAVAVALGKDIQPYTADMIHPIVSCLSDTDSRVRFYAIESLFNVVKCARENVIPLFNEIFIALGTAITDLDQNTRLGVESVDKLLKDIVTESRYFELAGFIEILRERMYTTNPFAHAFHLGWIEAIERIPNSKLTNYLPDFIDALFLMIGDRQQDIASKSENVMGQFLSNIKSDPTQTDFKRMINILVTHSQSQIPRIQIMALFWIKEFVNLSGHELLAFTSGILMAALSSNFFEEDKKKTLTDEEYKEIRTLSQEVNATMMQLVKTYVSSNPDGGLLELNSIIQTLLDQLKSGKTDAKSAVLWWMHHLFSCFPKKMDNNIQEVLPILLQTLSEQSDEVVILDLQVLAQICNNSCGENEHFYSCIRHLLDLFRKDRKLLDTKGSFIVRQLCLLLNPEDVYKTAAKFILDEKDLLHARHVVDKLNFILLTASELNKTRVKLKELKTKDSCDLFCCLYKSWSHSPTATIALCLMSGCYKHAGDIIKIIGQQPLTSEMMLELDRLIQLIESPMFTYLRMQLLDVNKSSDLLYALYALLMLMPQSNAFKMLQNRLSCVPHFQTNASLSRGQSDEGSRREMTTSKRSEINFQDLEDHFLKLLDEHDKALSESKLNYLKSRGFDQIDLTQPIKADQ